MPSTKLLDSNQEYLNILAVLPEYLASGARLIELNGKDNEENTKFLETLYANAHGLYEQQHYADAALIFAHLTVRDHWKVAYWLGLAGAQQMLGKYRLAIDSYGMVLALNMGNPAPCYRIAECLMALGEYDTAELVLKTVIDFADTDSPEHSALKRRAGSVTDLLQSAKAKARKEARQAGMPVAKAGGAS